MIDLNTLLASLWTTEFARPLVAYLYVDPGAGSMLLQLLLGGLAGLGVLVGLFKKKITRFLESGKSDDKH